MTHVFIVDDNTFKHHLEHMFAGTGAKDKQVNFLTNPTVPNDKQSFPSATERNLVAMIADISRVKVGDKIIFYLQSTSKRAGMFFGVFQAISNPFFDENDDKNYLKSDMKKGLSFRVLIAPDQVFSLGVTEHVLLDNIADKNNPYQLCWSLIYRKLKGNRGCTMITDYEYEELYNKLSVLNSGKTLNFSNYTYDSKQNAIVKANSTKKYLGRQNAIDIEPRMRYKAQQRGIAFETHLQAYVVRQIVEKDTSLLEKLGINPNLDFWIGNEVSCGVGMQRMDVMIIQEIGNVVNIFPIELKDEKPTDSIFNQISLYVDWIRQYVEPNYCDRGKEIRIFPFIIASKTTNSMIVNKMTSEDIGYISIELSNNQFMFNKLN